MRGLMYETTVNDSGEPLPEDALLYWQLRTAAAEERVTRALKLAQAADRAADFYAACAFLFFIGFVVIVVVMAVT